MFPWLRRLFGESQQQAVRASHDAARTTDENVKHWANTDSLAADSAYSPGLRKTLRERARYEAQENNSIAKGIVLTMAYDTVGSGPRLQVTTGDRDVNTQIERRFTEWAEEIRFAEKLRTMKIAKTIDGESFAHFRTNYTLRSPVKIDLLVDECDRYQSPLWYVDDPQFVDGVRFDDTGRPVSYDRLRQHPGHVIAGASLLDYDTLRAEDVIHLFRCDRPEQHRGVSELAPALPLFAQWRRYKLACLAAAETAADLAGIIHTQSSPNDDPADMEALDAIPIQQRVLMTLPKGWVMSQMRSEQPPTTLEVFERSILQEMARCLHVPYNVAAGNSSGYNFASGKLDYQIYGKATSVERHYLESACINRVFDAWLFEARLIPGFMPDGIDVLRLPRTWFWDDVRPDIDPMKSAAAQRTRLQSGTSTLPREYASMGLDWEVEQERAAESLGVSLENYQMMLRLSLFEVAPDEETEEEGVDEVEEA